MTRFSRSILASLLAAAIPASPAWAQTAIQPGSIVGTFNAQGYMSEGTLLTVPGDRAARVTDVVITNYTASSCNVAFYFGSTVFIARVTPDVSFTLQLNSGFGLLPGATVSPASAGCATNSVYWQIRGYYFTIP